MQMPFSLIFVSLSILPHKLIGRLNISTVCSDSSLFSLSLETKISWNYLVIKSSSWLRNFYKLLQNYRRFDKNQMWFKGVFVFCISFENIRDANFYTFHHGIEFTFYIYSFYFHDLSQIRQHSAFYTLETIALSTLIKLNDD